MNESDSWHAAAVQKIKVKIGEYESLDRFERCLWITDYVSQPDAVVEQIERVAKMAN